MLCGGFFFAERLAVLLLEAFNAACRVNEFLLACEEWVTIRANFDAERIPVNGRTRHKLMSAAYAVNEDGMVIGVYAFFHCFLSDLDGFCRRGLYRTWKTL